MPSEYATLDDRPLDQWKVTELKDELRRRKMTTKGLKEDLLKRLDEAVRSERSLPENQEISENPQSQPHPNDTNHSVPDPQSAQVNVLDSHSTHSNDSNSDLDLHSTPTIALGKGADETIEHSIIEKSDNHALMLDINAAVEDAEVEPLPQETIKTVDLEDTAEEKAISVSHLSDDSTVEHEKDADHTNDASNINSNHDDAVVSETQESKVSPALGLNTVSLSENLELKNDLNANNVHLEEEPVKPEDGDSQHLDINQEPADSKVSLGEEDDLMENINEEQAKKSDVSGGGSPEKLNLDRSSGDESMDEDVLEAKNAEPNDISIEEGVLKGVRDVHVVKEEASVNVEAIEFLPDKKDILSEGEIGPSSSVDKRKAEEQGSAGSAEPAKRQRRWLSEGVKVPDKPVLQPSNQVVGPATPKEFPGLDAVSPKERVVPPSQKKATTSLRIDRFVRPFTLKAVQELLAKTGSVSSFWMDHIKTHCYVTYTTVEEATATRNAVYNLQWPPNGGRQLIADFVTPEEVRARVEPPPPPPQPSAPPTDPPAVSAPSDHSPVTVPVAPRVPLRERLLPPPPPPPPVKVAEPPPLLTLDDLFKKTSAAPHIYYLPLTDAQVKAKVGTSQR